MEVFSILDDSSNKVKIAIYDKYKWTENINRLNRLNRLKLKNIYTIFLLIHSFSFYSILYFEIYLIFSKKSNK
jgi:hypothetical protein